MNLRSERNAILVLCFEKEVLGKERNSINNCVALTIDPPK